MREEEWVRKVAVYHLNDEKIIGQRALVYLLALIIIYGTLWVLRSCVG